MTILTPSSEADTQTTAPVEIETDSNHRMDEWIAFLRDIVIILVLVVFVRTYVAAPFRISGSSMEENYHDGEFIVVDKFSYANFGLFTVGNPNRGDVVVIKPHADNGKDFYIKRIIGLPGESVKLENGSVYIKQVGAKDYTMLNETYLSAINFGKTLPGRSS